ncbi:helix-turn-helix domain-containing protein [Roseburia intestinalis]
MDYYAIGQRIRKFRKACGLSQEELAEKVGISTTHMSHIETGNTKLSLQVLVDIASTLSVQTDELLYELSAQNTHALKQELADLLMTCSPREINILLDVLKSVRVSLNKYLS